MEINEKHWKSMNINLLNWLSLRFQICFVSNNVRCVASSMFFVSGLLIVQTQLRDGLLNMFTAGQWRMRYLTLPVQLFTGTRFGDCHTLFSLRAKNGCGNPFSAPLVAAWANLYIANEENLFTWDIYQIKNSNTTLNLPVRDSANSVCRASWKCISARCTGCVSHHRDRSTNAAAVWAPFCAIQHLGNWTKWALYWFFVFFWHPWLRLFNSFFLTLSARALVKYLG